MFGKMLQLTSEGVKKRVYKTQEAQICTLKRLDSNEPQGPVVNMKGQSKLCHRVTLPSKTVANLKIKLPEKMSKAQWAGGGFDDFLNLMNFLVFLIL